MEWNDELRKRLDSYLKRNEIKNSEGLPISIKVRVSSGCFHREHSPNAYIIIDEFTLNNNDKSIELIEHENGPELLIYVAFATSILSLSAQVINFVTAIIKARSEGIKKGDQPKESIELIVRGFDNERKLQQESLLKINSGDKIDSKTIEKIMDKALNKFVK